MSGWEGIADRNRTWLAKRDVNKLKAENERLRDALRAITEVDRYGLPGLIAAQTLREKS